MYLYTWKLWDSYGKYAGIYKQQAENDIKAEEYVNEELILMCGSRSGSSYKLISKV